MTRITPLAALTARIERLESERASDAKVVADAKRHVLSLCRQARRILEDNKQLRIEAAKWYGEWASLSQDDGKTEREITRLQEQIQAMAGDPSEVIRHSGIYQCIDCSEVFSAPHLHQCAKAPPVSGAIQDFLTNTTPASEQNRLFRPVSTKGYTPEPMAALAGIKPRPPASK